MLKLKRGNRCASCYTERIVRHCPRKDKDLCWACCNALRCDTHCPEACPYAAKMPDNSPFPAFRADSRAEGEQVLNLHLDLWIARENPALEGQTPLAYAQNNPQQALSWLSGYQYPPQFPIGNLMQKLGFEPGESHPLSDPEAVVEGYMNALIRLAWDGLWQYSVNQNASEDKKQRYRELLQAIPMLSKISTYSVIHSGLGEDGTTALVFIELNHRQNWTLVLSNSTGEWKIRQNITDTPQAYFAQNKAYAAIAEALGMGEDSIAWDLIIENLKVYPDSPDLYYYRALYWQLVKQNDKAGVDFFNAIALDNSWQAPYFHLGALCLAKSDFRQAREWYTELTKLAPDNPNALNNLAASYAGEGNYAEAKLIWQKLLTLYPTFELAKQNLEKLP